MIVSRPFGGLVRHVDTRGVPACGAKAHGSLVVESVKHSTCPDCKLLFSRFLETILSRRGN